MANGQQERTFANMRCLLPALLLALPSFAQDAALPHLIPAPVEVNIQQGTCPLFVSPWDLTLPVSFPEHIREELLALHPSKELSSMSGLPISFQLLAIDTVTPPEWYSLTVRRDGITVTAPTEEGLYRGSRTLVQLLEQGRDTGTLPCLSITDWPRFPWRGMHLDVSRHFFPIDFVKKYIDLLARYKMNSFHWHLTEDQGWRIEIMKYPKLTEVGAWRNGSQIGPYAAQTFDTLRYGGFYTQEQIREVVAYAAERHITIVPEIEMPGHAMAALASYPHLGCTGGPYEVQRGWGVFDEVFCAGNDSVFTFLEDVLTEEMDLFPGEYIHIGGDECPKTRWKECAKCQGRMQTEGLKDEHELQSYFIQRIEKFVNAKGRKIIGWDEILEGGLAPNAAVMSWRGTEGGIAAAKARHHAVMSPGSHCYFDHYQGDPANEPVAIGGYTTVQKVYSYEPIPEALNEDEAKYILGAQGNVWTEYILTPEHVEYMAVPRMLALAEVLWTPKKRRDEADFMRRLEAEFPRLEEMGVNASKSIYQVQIRPSPGKNLGTIDVHLEASHQGTILRKCHCDSKSGPVRFGLEEDAPQVNIPDQDACDWWGIVTKQHCTREPAPYSKPITIDWSTEIHAWMKNDPQGTVTEFPVISHSFHFNLATARPITFSTPPNERYSTGGAFTLVDGIRGSSRRVDNEWLAWKDDVTITVDLGEEREIDTISIGALGDTHSWIHLPQDAVMSVSSDGSSFKEVGRSAPAASATGKVELRATVRTTARHVRIDVRAAGPIPEGLPGAGNPAWLFLDEVEVR